MITAILPAVVALAIVATYMTIVHRMLRADEHWHESDLVKAATKPGAATPHLAAPEAAHA